MMYKGQHSLTFYSIDEMFFDGNIANNVGSTVYNTWDQFHLIPTSRPVFNLPEVKSEYVDVPQRDGSIDLTTKLGWKNLPRYGMRKGTWEFWVPSFLSEWPVDFQKLANAVHGLTKMVVSEDDPYYYYKGRITVDSWQNGNDGNGNKVTLGYTLDPFKTQRYYWSQTKQQWNPFCFLTDYFYNANDSAITSIMLEPGQTVDYLIPSDTPHTTPHTEAITYPFLETTPRTLFSGMVQSPFYINVYASGTVTTESVISVDFENSEVTGHGSVSRRFKPFSSSVNTAKLTDDIFIVSHRSLQNNTRISVTNETQSYVYVALYLQLRSL